MIGNGRDSTGHVSRLLRELDRELSRRELPPDEARRGATALARLEALLQGTPQPWPADEGLSFNPPDPAAAHGLRYRELFDFAPDGQVLTDWSGIILAANLAAAHLLDSRREFLIGKPLPLYIGPRHRF